MRKKSSVYFFVCYNIAPAPQKQGRHITALCQKLSKI